MGEIRIRHYELEIGVLAMGNCPLVLCRQLPTIHNFSSIYTVK